MTGTRTFHLGDLITVVTGHLVSPNHIDAVYDVCDFVTGEAHMTHQLPRASRAITPWLVEQHPWLADIKVPDFAGADERAVFAWLDEQVARYGQQHEVTAMPPGMYVGREPIGELREMAPQAAMITIVVPPGGAS